MRQIRQTPPGTSKWNRIEHRLFSYIAMNWRGKPLVSLATVVNLIGATTTRSGLRVRSEIDTRSYPQGVKVTDEQMQNINLSRHEFSRRLELYDPADICQLIPKWIICFALVPKRAIRRQHGDALLRRIKCFEEPGSSLSCARDLVMMLSHRCRSSQERRRYGYKGGTHGPTVHPLAGCRQAAAGPESGNGAGTTARRVGGVRLRGWIGVLQVR